MFKEWSADELYVCPTIENLLVAAAGVPAKNYTIKSGNTWYGGGVLVVNKKLRMCVIQADDEVYPIHVNQSRSTKYNSLKHVQLIQGAAAIAGYGEVVHPWVSTEERAITTRAKFELLKEEVFNAALRGYDPVFRYMNMRTSNGMRSFPPVYHDELIGHIERDVKFRPAFDALADRLHALSEKFARSYWLKKPYKLQHYTDKFQTAKAGAANRTDQIAEMRRTNGRRAA
tara:strand:+ start:427 stop:1113 length:687 start_codon:yes stop_codon:yes gene_type:complete